MKNSVRSYVRGLMIISIFLFSASSHAAVSDAAAPASEKFIYGSCSPHAPSYTVRASESEIVSQRISFYGRSHATLELDLVTGKLHLEAIADLSLDKTPLIKDLTSSDAEYNAEVRGLRDMLAIIVEGEACYLPEPRAQKYVDLLSNLLAE